MSRNPIQVIVVNPLSAPGVAIIEHSLENMQKLVGGHIECVAFSGSPILGRGVDLWCNEEGKLLGLSQNRMFPDGTDLIAGTFFLAAHDGEGETVGLTDEEVREVIAALEAWPMLIDLGYLQQMTELKGKTT